MVSQLARICEQKFGVAGEQCLLYPTSKTADHCRAFLLDQPSHSGSPPLVRLKRYLIFPEQKQEFEPDASRCKPAPRFAELYIVLFPADTFPLARQCWQHTGMGISSRYAEYCLSLMPEEPSSPIVTQLIDDHEHDSSEAKIPSIKTGGHDASGRIKDQIDYYGEVDNQTSPVGSAAVAKLELRHRIASVLVRNSPLGCHAGPCKTKQVVETGSLPSEVKDVTENDVFLFPTGMYAIWNAYDMVTRTRPAAKSICFGYVVRS